jgi:hypothetical protein
MNYKDYDLNKLPPRKRYEMKYLYPITKWIYVRYYSFYGFYWAFKLFKGNFNLPIWEQWSICFFAMCSLYFFAREEGLDGFFKTNN